MESPSFVCWNELSEAQRHALLARPILTSNREISETARAVLSRVRREGDAALFALTKQFDGAELTSLRVSADEISAAERLLSRDASNAIDRAIGNVRRFHEAQTVPPIDIETEPGVRCQRLSRAIDAVGLYVPAGTAPLPSAAIMLAVPATIAGCRRRVLCTPPGANGEADSATVVAATRAGIDEIWKVGGAQAIGALAYGTTSIARVDKIFGPGNAYVTAAKTLVSAEPGGPAIDMPAGPSEVLVIADESASAEFVAADLLSQAEHGDDSQTVLVTTSTGLAERVESELVTQLQALDRRTIAGRALANSRLIVCDDLETAVSISNEYAPEHLIVQTQGARDLLPSITNAGSVFLGRWTPESVGDYCSGTNHVLPTYGAARNYSGLGIEQFIRQMTVQEVSLDGLRSLAPTVIELARLEGLDAHAAAVSVRLKHAAGGGK
ncbi:MAG: histidinol dehydrogenase [Woeseia sp.]|nr:histidinol dehydrogenase [Woeseia sp.]MBT8097451.1 histidinol dehydrogenase [Woeseia sp.]NNE59419.1 histidinol dehydrogenase [Woeseia sp.]NNL53527.1 histidinol dehydrogenase [Woeseia sp.]